MVTDTSQSVAPLGYLCKLEASGCGWSWVTMQLDRVNLDLEA